MFVLPDELNGRFHKAISWDGCVGSTVHEAAVSCEWHGWDFSGSLWVWCNLSSLKLCLQKKQTVISVIKDFQGFFFCYIIF